MYFVLILNLGIKNGFLTEKYKPYTLFDGEKAVANVSVNTCKFYVYGKERVYLQLDTVMTDANYRNKGLIRKILQEIEYDYAEKCDGYF